MCKVFVLFSFEIDNFLDVWIVILIVLKKYVEGCGGVRIG